MTEAGVDTVALGATRPPEGRENATGATGRRSSAYGGAQDRLLGGRLRAGSCGVPHRDGESPRAQEADNLQATHAEHRAPGEVYPGHAKHEGRHGLRRELSRTARAPRELPAPRRRGAPGTVRLGSRPAARAWPRDPG